MIRFRYEAESTIIILSYIPNRVFVISMRNCKYLSKPKKISFRFRLRR